MTERQRETSKRAEPRFDIDYAYGRQGELQIGQLLEWIASGNGQVEVKTKRYLDFYFYVETGCDKCRKGTYEASGIMVSTAHVWAICLGHSGVSIVVPTELIREMLDDPSSSDRSEDLGTCPTRGKLINLVALVYREKQKQEKADKEAKAKAAAPFGKVEPPSVDSIKWG